MEGAIEPENEDRHDSSPVFGSPVSQSLGPSAKGNFTEGIPTDSPANRACAAGITKMFYLDDYGKYGDFLWDSAPITIWCVASTSVRRTRQCSYFTSRTTVEICVAIIAASAYALKPLFQAILKDRTAGSNGYSKRNTKIPSGGSGSAKRIRMRPDYNSVDMELGSQPSREPIINGGLNSNSSHGSSQHYHEENLITKTTDLAVFVSDRRPSDDARVEKEEAFEYGPRHH